MADEDVEPEPDAGPGQDIGPEPDTGTDPDPDPPTRPDLDGVYEAIDGPPGITIDLVVDGVAYAHSSANDTTEEPVIEWRSEDGGRTWQPLTDSGIDAVLAETRDAAYTEVGGFRVLATRQGLYRAEADSEVFEAVDKNLPGELQKLGSTDEVLVAQVQEEGAKALYRSDDVGDSWTSLQTEGPGVMGFDTWNQKIFVRTFSSFESSSDHGDSFESHTLPPGGLPNVNNWWAKGDQALYVYYLDGSAGYKMARSTDGATWTDVALTNAHDGNLQTFMAVGDELYATTLRGVLIRLPKDGGEVEVVVDEPQAPGAVSKVYVAGEELLLTGGGGSLRWEPGQTSYEPIDGGIGHVGQLAIADGEVWAHGHYSLYRYSDGAWTHLTAPEESYGWGNASLFVLDDTLFVADGSDCLFRRDQDQWQFLFQWNSLGIETSCDDALGGNGDISGILAIDGAVYVGQTGNFLTGSHAGETRPVEGGLMRSEDDLQTLEKVDSDGASFSHTPHIMAMQRFENSLFVSVRQMVAQREFVTDIYEITDSDWLVRTEHVLDTGGVEVDDARATSLLETRHGVYATIQMPGEENHTASGRAQWDPEETTWRLLPELPEPIDPFQSSFIASTDDEAIYAAAGTNIYRLDGGHQAPDLRAGHRWQQVGQGLPDDMGPVMNLAVDGPDLYVHLQRGGVWKLVAQDGQ